MFGLDDAIASLSDAASLPLVVAVAVLLGLRHATDPDHLAALTVLIASRREACARAAAGLGAAWGLGHGLTLFAFGLPIVLFRAYLPEWTQQAAEVTIGLVIIALAVGLLLRWRRDSFHLHRHEHRGHGHEHAHVHSHASDFGHAHLHAARPRSPLQAFSIGLLHGMGGSAGVGGLLIATIESHVYAVVALSLFALFTAVSMTVLTSGLGLGAGRAVQKLAPALGVASFGFGVWYTLGAINLAPYVF